METLLPCDGKRDLLPSPLYLSNSHEFDNEGQVESSKREEKLWSALNRNCPHDENLSALTPSPEEGDKALYNRIKENANCGLFSCARKNNNMSSMTNLGLKMRSPLSFDDLRVECSSSLEFNDDVLRTPPLHSTPSPPRGVAKFQKKKKSQRRRSMGDEAFNRTAREAQYESLQRNRSWVPSPRVDEEINTPGGKTNEEMNKLKYKLALNELPIDAAKAHLLTVLKAADGEPNDRHVIEAARRLAREDRASQQLYNNDIVPPSTRCAIGTWKALTRAHFPGTLGPDPDCSGAYLYTLGRMSFGLFAPADVIISVLGSCQNIIQPLPKHERINLMMPPAVAQAAKNDKRGIADHIRKYQIKVRFTVKDERGQGLQGIITTYGYCAPASQTEKADDASHRLSVWFVGGDLSHDPFTSPEQENLWSELFGTQAQHDHLHRGVFSKATLWFISAALGIKLDPIDNSGYQSYSVQRPVLGYMDILYADEDFRVTRGNRNTLFVLKRVPKKQSTPPSTLSTPTAYHKYE